MANDPQTTPLIFDFHPSVCRLTAGMSDCYESMSRTPIRDEWFPPLISSFRRKPESRGVGRGDWRRGPPA